VFQRPTFQRNISSSTASFCDHSLFNAGQRAFGQKPPKFPRRLETVRRFSLFSYSPFLVVRKILSNGCIVFLLEGASGDCVVKRSISRSLHQNWSLDSASDLLRRCVNHTDLRSMLNAIIHLSFKSPFLPFSLRMLMYAMSQTWHNFTWTKIVADRSADKIMVQG